MECTLKYGEGFLKLHLPDSADVTVMRNAAIAPLDDVKAALRAALAALLAPPGATPLYQRPCPASVAIAVPDETRPVPLKILLPELLAHLHKTWPELRPENVRLVVGGGLHPQPDIAQMQRILPEAVLNGGYVCLGHDAQSSPMVHYGTTCRGTPVEINSAYAQAAFKVVIGMIDPHPFVGMTGGSKGVTIGCASAAMIRHNHSLMTAPEAQAGRFVDNPVRLDLHEAGRMVSIDLAVNMVLNPAKQMVALVAGDPVLCMEEGAQVTSRLYGQHCAQPFDVVVASCGGMPKDICLYQAQKGLNLASHCLKEGGKLLLLAACSQGVGDDHYHNYVRGFDSPEAQMQEFAERGFRMGAHKAYLFSRTLTRFEVVVHSEMTAEVLAGCHMRRGDAQTTVDTWLTAMPQARVAVIPNANTMYFHKTP